MENPELIQETIDALENGTGGSTGCVTDIVTCHNQMKYMSDQTGLSAEEIEEIINPGGGFNPLCDCTEDPESGSFEECVKRQIINKEARDLGLSEIIGCEPTQRTDWNNSSDQQKINQLLLAIKWHNWIEGCGNEVILDKFFNNLGSGSGQGETFYGHLPNDAGVEIRLEYVGYFCENAQGFEVIRAAPDAERNVGPDNPGGPNRYSLDFVCSTFTSNPAGKISLNYLAMDSDKVRAYLKI